MKKYYVVLAICALILAYLAGPLTALFFLFLVMMMDHLLEQREYLKRKAGKEIKEKIEAILDLDERIRFQSSLSRKDLFLYFYELKCQNEAILDVKEDVLILRMTEVHASEESQKAAAYVYKQLLDFLGRESPYLKN